MSLLYCFINPQNRRKSSACGVLIDEGFEDSGELLLLKDALCQMVPPEEAVRVTRLTGQALFYKDPDSLKHKVLAIAEDEGAFGAVYSLRTLASDQHLAIAATRTGPADRADAQPLRATDDG